MAGNRVLIDTNVLIYASARGSPMHTKAIQAIHNQSQANSEMWVSRQVLREYLSWRTRQSTRSLAAAAIATVADIGAFQQMFNVADDTSTVTAALLSLVTSFPTGGKQVHDANLVATMQVYGITSILTHNVKDFARFGALITVVPIDV